MSQTSEPKNLPNPNRNLPAVDLDHEKDSLEKFIDSVKPYANLIGLGLLALFLLFLAIIWMMKVRSDLEEGKWITLSRQMGVFTQTSNTSSLKEVAEQFPDSSAGFWALQVAGDFDLRSGILELARDRQAGFREINKAKDTLKKLVDVDPVLKSPLLQQMSLSSLAYAHESLGEFDEAERLYRQLVESVPDTAFGQRAAEGLARVTDSSFHAVYQKFKDWEDPLSIAPGPAITPSPDISFPDVTDIPPGEGTPPTAEQEGVNETEEEGGKVEGDGTQTEGDGI